MDPKGFGEWLREHHPEDTWIRWSGAAEAAAKVRAVRGEVIPGLAVFEVRPLGEALSGRCEVCGSDVWASPA